MLVPQKRCNICKLVKENKPLLKRIYESTHFIPHGKESLHQIANDTGLNYKALRIHVKKHQFLNSQDYQEKMLQNYDQQVSIKATAKAVKAVNSIQSVIEKGQERLDSGEITVNTDQLIRASQIKMADEAKQKDQDLMAVSLAHFMSGESTNERVYIEADE